MPHVQLSFLLGTRIKNSIIQSRFSFKFKELQCFKKKFCLVTCYLRNGFVFWIRVSLGSPCWPRTLDSLSLPPQRTCFFLSVFSGIHCTFCPVNKISRKLVFLNTFSVHLWSFLEQWLSLCWIIFVLYHSFWIHYDFFSSLSFIFMMFILLVFFCCLFIRSVIVIIRFVIVLLS
jgi:hypothetical protein